MAPCSKLALQLAPPADRSPSVPFPPAGAGGKLYYNLCWRCVKGATSWSYAQHLWAKHSQTKEAKAASKRYRGVNPLMLGNDPIFQGSEGGSR